MPDPLGPTLKRFDEAALRAVSERLSALSRRRITEDMPSAAVLVPLIDHQQEPAVLFTKRSDTVGTHKGQVSFPGGRMDPEDPDEVACALRELDEELGIKAHRVRVLGVFHDVISINGMRVTPVVAYLGTIDAPHMLQHSPGEIDETFALPLRRLLAPTDREVRALGPRVAPFFTAGPHPVWGLTAFILDEVLREVLGFDLPPLHLPDQP